METIEEYVKDLLRTEDAGKVLQQALTPKSAGGPNNERLEFLGNAVLNMRVAEAIYEMEQQSPPGTMSLMCNYLRSNPVLVMAGREGGLAMMLAKHHADDGKVTDKMVSTAFEAIVGMLYRHVGYEAASGFLDRFLLTDDLLSSSTTGKGPITDLKELVDRNRGSLVVTHSLSESNEEGQLVFRHTTVVNGRPVTGEGRTKKRAEAMAAAKALALSRSMELNQT
jgi:ribonuclease III